MFVIPFQISEQEYNVVIVLEDDNIERIKDHDPAEVHANLMPDHFASRELKSVIVAYVSPGEKDKFIAMMQSGNGDKAFDLLSRGFKFRPDKGDHDFPYTSLKTP